MTCSRQAEQKDTQPSRQQPASSTYLEPSRQKLVLDLQEVPSAHLSFERLVEDGKPHVVLHILPASVAVSGGRPSQGHWRVIRCVFAASRFEGSIIPRSVCFGSVFQGDSGAHASPFKSSHVCTPARLHSDPHHSSSVLESYKKNMQHFYFCLTA